MSSPYRFDLEKALAAWRRALEHNPAFTGDDVDELEQHVRDQVAAASAEGLCEEEGFRRAMALMGDYDTAEGEYGKVYWGKLRHRRELFNELTWRFAMFRNYLMIAYRNLLRQRTYSLINVAGLGVAIACCLLILLYVKDELSYDRFHVNGDRIFQVLSVSSREDSESVLAVTPIPMSEALNTTFPEVEHVVPVYREEGIVRIDAESFEEDLFFVGPDFFEMFSFEMLEGAPATALKSAGSIVLTRETALKYFGTASALGRQLSVRVGDTFFDYTVTGISRRPPRQSSIQFDLLLPYQQVRQFSYGHENPSWRTFANHLYIQLPDPDSDVLFASKLKSLAQAHLPEGDAASMSFRLLPLTRIHLTPEIINPLEPSSRPAYAYILGCIAAAILLIACANFTTLALGRGTARTREVGVRKVLGAQRTQLVRQFWLEAVLLSGIAVLVGVVLASAVLPAFGVLVNKQFVVGDLFGLPQGLALGGVWLLTSLMAGIYPAVYLSGFQPANVLKGGPFIQGRRRFAHALVVGQFTLAVVFIGSMLVMWRQLDHVRNTDLGFRSEQVIRIATHMPDQHSASKDLLDRFRSELAGHSEIVGVTGSWEEFGGDDGVYNQLPTTSDGSEIQAAALRTDYEVVETWGLTLNEGRAFSREYGADAASAVMVNEALVRAFEWDEPIGKRLDVLFTVEDATVVGVVEDFHFRSLHHSLEPMVMHMSPHAGIRFIYVRTSPGNLSERVDILQATWKKLAPDLPFTFTFLDEQVERQYEADQRWARIILLASVLAVCIACLGLYGLAALRAAQRTKEIGIRKVLGASIPGIVSLLAKDFIMLVFIAFVVGAPLAYLAMQRWLEDFAYRIDIGPGIFVLSGLLVLLIAVLTVSYQAIKAAAANPVESLRYE